MVGVSRDTGAALSLETGLETAVSGIAPRGIIEMILSKVLPIVLDRSIKPKSRMKYCRETLCSHSDSGILIPDC